MKRLRLDRFTGFFAAVHGGYEPFPWQQRLVRRVVAGHWPQGISLPTASGKTACIDIAVFAMACQTDWPDDRPRTAPRRVFFVVDRRVVVDEAFEHARALARALTDAKKGILREVADRLRKLGHLNNEEPPLTCFQLRGGIYRDDAWAKTPLQPTVIASTVDQIGSRLLFRGYGLRAGYSRPAHAGLAANDSLILVDEAHCANPFRQSALAVAEYRRRAQHHLAAPFATVLMSATLPPDIEEDQIERAQKDDRDHPVLGLRIKARKPTRLVAAAKAEGAGALERLAEQLASEAVQLAKTGAKAIGVIVNRVATARQVHARLRREKNADHVLLTGRMRPIDRDAVLGTWHDKLAAKEGRPPLERPAFVVATQCLEVGANLDFDALVSECASLDALRQRFGRLNRLGLKSPSLGVIVIRGDQIKPKEDDPVYGPALTATWEWLVGQAKKGQIDMGIATVEKSLPRSSKKRRELLETLQAPAPDAPVMLPAHVDCWVQTSPAPCPDPDVAVFLHGPERGAPEVQVVWRADLPLRVAAADDDEQSAWIETVILCPPTAAECMPVPLHVLRKWWKGEDTSDLTDVVGGRVEAGQRQTALAPRRALRWLGPQDSELVSDPDRIQPGDTVVLPAAVGGWNVLGLIPGVSDGDVTVDRGEESYRMARGRAVLRLHPELLSQWPPEARAALAEFMQAEDLSDDPTGIRDVLSELAGAGRCPPRLQRIVGELADDPGVEVQWYPASVRETETVEPPRGVVLSGSRHLPLREPGGETFTNEDDTASLTRRVGLDQHCEGVVRQVRHFATACGLAKKTVGDLVLAARFHDVGKADPRFQVWLNGGRLATASVGLLAKSAGLASRVLRQEARRRSGYPPNGRHELLSVRLLESAPQLLERAHDPDLVLHLIGAHHGRCRPFAPVVADPSELTVALDHASHSLRAEASTRLERIDSGVAERFWKLVRRYGWWGLAWLEAVFILSDHRRSEAEQRKALGKQP